MNTPPHPLVIVVTQAGVNAATAQPPSAPDPEPRERILAALAGRCLKAKELAAAAGVSERWVITLTRRLRAEGLVKQKKGQGYYRPDAPPA